MTNLDREKLELIYFNFIRLYLQQQCYSLVREIKSLIGKEKNLGSFFHYLFKQIFRYPIGLPIDNLLIFVLPDAFIHIEVKTALVGNPADYKGKINIALNQTSYRVNKVFSPNLPQYYKPDGNKAKPCLTYVIQIIYEHAKPDLKALKLICIPNGQLYPHYGRKVFKSGKGGYAKARDFRFNYSVEPYFKILSKHYNEKIFRVELIYLARKLMAEDITNLKDVPVHFQF